MKVTIALKSFGAARNRSIGTAPSERPAKADLERARTRSDADKGATAKKTARGTGEPLSGLQWDMKQIGATTAGP